MQKMSQRQWEMKMNTVIKFRLALFMLMGVSCVFNKPVPNEDVVFSSIQPGVWRLQSEDKTVLYFKFTIEPDVEFNKTQWNSFSPASFANVSFDVTENSGNITVHADQGVIINNKVVVSNNISGVLIVGVGLKTVNVVSDVILSRGTIEKLSVWEFADQYGNLKKIYLLVYAK